MKKTLKKIGAKNIKNYAVTLACGCNCTCYQHSKNDYYYKQVVAGYN